MHTNALYREKIQEKLVEKWGAICNDESWVIERASNPAHQYYWFLEHVVGGRAMAYCGYLDSRKGFRCRFFYGGYLVFQYSNGVMLITASDNISRRLSRYQTDTRFSRLSDLKTNAQFLEEVDSAIQYLEEVDSAIRYNGDVSGFIINLNQEGSLKQLEDLINYAYASAGEAPKSLLNNHSFGAFSTRALEL